MEKFNIIRHGNKLEAGEERRPLQESGLPEKQQQKWSEAIRRLNIQGDPEITYGSLPLIEKIAQDIYEQLPDKATVIFTSTAYNRTKLTADFLSTSLMEKLQEKNDKEIAVAFLWETPHHL